MSDATAGANLLLALRLLVAIETSSPPHTAHFFKMDRQSVYTLSLFGESATNGEESNKQLQQKIIKFVLEFHLDGIYIYRSARKPSMRFGQR